MDRDEFWGSVLVLLRIELLVRFQALTLIEIVDWLVLGLSFPLDVRVTALVDN